MSASCYLCELNFGVLTKYSQGDAVGACKLCGVLACLAHGIRDKNRPAYVCGVCIPNLLAVAARNRLGTGEGPPEIAPIPDEPAPEAPSGFVQWASTIESVSDVISDFDDDHWASIRKDMTYLSRLLASREAPPALRAFARPDADQARELMAAAAALATQLNLPPDEMIAALEQAVASVLSRRV